MVIVPLPSASPRILPAAEVTAVPAKSNTAEVTAAASVNIAALNNTDLFFYILKVIKSHLGVIPLFRNMGFY